MNAPSNACYYCNSFCKPALSCSGSSGRYKNGKQHGQAVRLCRTNIQMNNYDTQFSPILNLESPSNKVHAFEMLEEKGTDEQRELSKRPAHLTLKQKIILDLRQLFQPPHYQAIIFYLCFLFNNPF